MTLRVTLSCMKRGVLWYLDIFMHLVHYLFLANRKKTSVLVWVHLQKLWSTLGNLHQK